MVQNLLSIEHILLVYVVIAYKRQFQHVPTTYDAKQ